MQLDIYRRPEPEHKLSFLAVPAGAPIPEEATSVEWQREATAVELDVDGGRIGEYAIEDAGAQIREKGYAMTSVQNQIEARD